MDMLLKEFNSSSLTGQRELEDRFVGRLSWNEINACLVLSQVELGNKLTFVVHLAVHTAPCSSNMNVQQW